MEGGPMADLHKSGDTSQQSQLAILRGVLKRFAQAEHPENFAVAEQVLLERLKELEEATADRFVVAQA
jgi:hypothetical protein